MKKEIVKRLGLCFLMLAILSAPGLLSAERDVHSPPFPSAPNPLIEEMMVLDQTFREIVSAVSLGDGERVNRALESMHGTMEKTHEGLHSGTVKIPKNAHRLKEFLKLDTRFHADLKALANAAKKNNQGKMAALTKKLLDGCINCHRNFRK